VSNTTLAGAVLLIALVSGTGYYFIGRGAGGQTTSTSVSVSAAISSASSTSTSRSASGRVILVFDAPLALASSDVVANYTMTLTALGNVPSVLTLSAAAPPGVTVTLDPSVFTVGTSAAPVASIQVDSGTTPGTYGVNVTASSGGESYTNALPLQVVKFLVVTVGTQFVPENMTVPVNSTVYWMRLNGPISQYDNGQHNVVFLNDSLPSSPALQQWESYSYQFMAVGDYPYYCTFHPWQKGDIDVTP
jgi:plastocyanin